MGFIRGVVIIIFSILLFFSLLFMEFSLIVSLSLQHDIFQPALNSSISELTNTPYSNQIAFNQEQLDTLYYTEYNCSFWQCIKDSIANSSPPLVLFSEKAREYWNSTFWILAGLSLLIFALIFLISKNRSTTFIVTGILLVVSALPFRRMYWIFKILNQGISSIFSVFFTRAHSAFILMLTLGIILITAGILCKIFGWKMKFKKSEEELKTNQKRRNK